MTTTSSEEHGSSCSERYTYLYILSIRTKLNVQEARKVLPARRVSTLSDLPGVQPIEDEREALKELA